ncbi:MAG: hypothetical protein A2234_06625 [Elusimicrobia bacterium RIFOXYA2_FULL_58_8]|nr:MAG: hypothetical protein A2234_06625 [Elusimicrobia bacterium RIFOXYA2_FULL_58_8]OGS13090.1 MAG: hypothetical protein A2285_10085 [Elusimicrobia bacterium RIFOXYA12_FULL_57_11]
MKITPLLVFVFSTFAVALFAQAPGKKDSAPAPEAKQAVLVKAQSADEKSGKTAPARKTAKKQSEPEAEEGTVMIDSKSDPDDAGRFVPQSEDSAGEREADVPGGMPASYGQCKGVLNEGGRSILVFESSEDGAIYFVQLTVGKSGVSWKLLSRISRSAD